MPQGRKGKGRSKENVFFDLNKIAGGKVELSKDDVERLCVHLLVEGYLEEMFQQTPYGVNVYLQSTDLALRLTRFTLGDIQQGKGPPVLCSFPEKGKTKRTDGQAAKEIPSTQGARKANDAGAIRKSPRMSSTSKYTNEDNEEGSSQDESYGNEDAHFIDDSDVDELSTDWWSRSLRDGSVPPGKRKLRSSTGRAQKRQRPTAPDDVIDLEEAADVIVISD
ncbi:hypothetical protein B0H21DRAFT_490978 [Amylocystis lapponica]|nr:hypothetical protein B0H21DRAFT_490978 [Amylocystis lapponica]